MIRFFFCARVWGYDHDDPHGGELDERREVEANLRFGDWVSDHRSRVQEQKFLARDSKLPRVIEIRFRSVFSFWSVCVISKSICTCDLLRRLCYVAGGHAIGSISGGSLNPAVSLAFDTVYTASTQGASWRCSCLLYSLFEFVGAIIAAAVSRNIVIGRRLDRFFFHRFTQWHCRIALVASRKRVKWYSQFMKSSLIWFQKRSYKRPRYYISKCPPRGGRMHSL